MEFFCLVFVLLSSFLFCPGSHVFVLPNAAYSAFTTTDTLQPVFQLNVDTAVTEDTDVGMAATAADT